MAGENAHVNLLGVKEKMEFVTETFSVCVLPLCTALLRLHNP